MEEGWSVKKMQRLMVLSNTYRQDSERSGSQGGRPENRLLSHQNHRRLEFEPLRNALLSVAGRLDLRRGGKADEEITTPPPFSDRRTVYCFHRPSEFPGLLRTYTSPAPTRRSASDTPRPRRRRRCS